MYKPKRSITGVRFELFAIGHSRDLQVNYVRFNSFFRNVSHSFQHLKGATDVFAQKNLPKDILKSKICYGNGNGNAFT